MKQFNPRLKGKWEATLDAERIDRHKIGAKRRSLNGLNKKLHMRAVICTKCDRGMSRYVAKMQLENKREDAPICIPCILGVKRRVIN